MLVMVILRAVDLGDLAESREQLERAVAGRAAECLALQILRRLDRAVGLHRDSERRPVVHDVDRDRRVFGLFGGKLDQRIDVAEAHVIRAVGDERDRSTGAVALIDRHLEAGGFEVAAVVGQEKPALRALVFPVQHHFQLGFGGRRRGAASGRPSERGGERDGGAAGKQAMTGSCWVCVCHVASAPGLSSAPE